MTKKEIAQNAVNQTFHNTGSLVGKVLQTIIDALPDEAPDNQYAPSRLTARDLKTLRNFKTPAPDPGSPCVICGGCISTYDTYAVFAMGRAHWNCVKHQASMVSSPETTPEDARKLRIMKAMEERCATDKLAVFKFGKGEWWRMTASGDFTWANWEPVETSVGTEPVEVKEPQPTSALCRMCEKLLIALYETGAHLKYYELQREFHSILGRNPEPPATSGATQSPEVAAAPLWEGEISVFGDSATSAKPDYPENKWRRIKVREVRP